MRETTHYAGTLQGSAGIVRQTAEPERGVVLMATSPRGGIRCSLHKDPDGEPRAVVDLVPCNGQGTARRIFDDRLGAFQEFAEQIEKLVRPTYGPQGGSII